MAEDTLAAFLKKNPDIQDVDAFIIDVNGVPRGKRLPVSSVKKVFSSGLRMPRSAFAVDIWGQDVLGAKLVLETGDGDGVCKGVESSLARAPWVKHPTAQLILSMYESDGSPFFADSRHVLKKVLDLYAKKGWTPVVAAELEFYLVDPTRDERGDPQAPLSPRTKKRSRESHMFNMDEMADFNDVLTEIHQTCRIQNIPTDTTISENGPGQMEINLMHGADALLAADQATLMKRVVRQVARKHGLDATFMAKPYVGKSGSGLHVHFSILDKNGKNIFAAAKGNHGTPLLRHAIGGLTRAMQDSMLVFAPNINSYRRFAPGAHAPTSVSWAYDNRTAAVRVPESDAVATRIEHRVAGADANIYLLMAVMLAGAYDGLVTKADPGKPLKGNVWDSKAKLLPNTLPDALKAFENSAFIAKYFGKHYRGVYAACKLQEKEIMDSRVSSAEIEAYMRDI